MRSRLVAFVRTCLLLALVACEPREPTEPSPPVAASTPALPQALPLAQRAAPAINSAIVGLEKALQANKLRPPPRREHAPQLAFGKGVLGQLTAAELRVFDTADFRLLATEPLEAPRALLSLADGSLLAVGGRAMFRWRRDKKTVTSLPRPVLLPSAELYADPQQADLLWIFDAGPRSGAKASATLSRYRLAPGGPALQLPEQTIELTSPSGGVFGPTREGVWLYLTPGHAERLSPGGLRLSSFALDQKPLPVWALPARRLDQSLWLDDAGEVSRVLVSPSYKHLRAARLAGPPFCADVGDEGRLLAVVVMTGAGPRFELELLDQDLAPRGRVILPTDEPTGADDWVRRVTENQNVAVAPREPRVAVGGRARVTIFDAEGKVVFFIPSR